MSSHSAPVRTRFVAAPKVRDLRPLASRQAVHEALGHATPKCTPEAHTGATYHKPGFASQSNLRMAGRDTAMVQSSLVSPVKPIKTTIKPISPRAAAIIGAFSK